jgi:hypothetical protein
VFTARYALSPYIKQICFVFKWLKEVNFLPLLLLSACILWRISNAIRCFNLMGMKAVTYTVDAEIADILRSGQGGRGYYAQSRGT